MLKALKSREGSLNLMSWSPAGGRSRAGHQDGLLSSSKASATAEALAFSGADKGASLPKDWPKGQSPAGTPGNLPTKLPWWRRTERGTHSTFYSIQRQNCQKLAPKCSYYVGESLGEKMRKEGNYAIENMYEARQNNEVQTQDSALNGNCI